MAADPLYIVRKGPLTRRRISEAPSQVLHDPEAPKPKPSEEKKDRKDKARTLEERPAPRHLTSF